MPPKNKPGGLCAPKKRKNPPPASPLILLRHVPFRRSRLFFLHHLSPCVVFPFIAHVSSFFTAYPREPGSIPGSRLLRSAPLTYDVSHVYWPLVHICLQE